MRLNNRNKTPLVLGKTLEDTIFYRSSTYTSIGTFRQRKEIAEQMAKVIGTGVNPISTGVVWDIPDDSAELELALDSGEARLLSPDEDYVLAPIHIASALVRGDYDPVNQPTTDPVELLLATSMGIDNAREIVSDPRSHDVPVKAFLELVADEDNENLVDQNQEQEPKKATSSEKQESSQIKRQQRRKSE